MMNPMISPYLLAPSLKRLDSRGKAPSAQHARDELGTPIGCQRLRQKMLRPLKRRENTLDNVSAQEGRNDAAAPSQAPKNTETRTPTLTSGRRREKQPDSATNQALDAKGLEHSPFEAYHSKQKSKSIQSGSLQTQITSTTKHESDKYRG